MTLTEAITYGPVALVALAYGLRRLRLLILARKAARPALVTPETPAPLLSVPEAQEQAQEPAKKAENPEDYYRRLKDAQTIEPVWVAAAHQEAQFRAVERNEDVILTLHDPRTVKEGDPPYTISPKPVDHPNPASVVVIDDRPLAQQDADTRKTVLTRPMREKHEKRQDARDEAIREASSGKLAGEIEAAKKYSRDTRIQARKDMEEAIPLIRADAEKLARKRLVPPRMDAFNAEAGERKVKVDVVIEEFVKKVADDAEKEARDRFESGTVYTKEQTFDINFWATTKAFRH